MVFELEEALIVERRRVGAAEAETKVAATRRDQLRQLNIVHMPSAEVTSWRAVSPLR